MDFVKMCFKLINQKKSDNRGTTLVEIIVALLILVLIFTPAYMAFSAALKLNQASKDKLYAQTIAQNAMEIIKYTMDAGGDIYTVNFSTLGGSAVNEDGTPNITPVVASGAAVATHSAIYEFTDCPEGTTTYDVKITIKDQEGKGKQTKFADMSAFNDTSTALINPSGIAGGFDSSVAEYFGALHRSYTTAGDQDVIAVFNAHNTQILDNWNYDCALARIAGNPEPPRPAKVVISDPHNPPVSGDPLYDKEWELPAGTLVLSNEEITHLLDKEMFVELSKKENPTNHIYYYVLNSYMNYFLTTNVLPHDHSKNIIDPTMNVPMKCDKYCDNVNYDDLDNIYIMYTPLNVSGSSIVELQHEVINIKNDLPAKTDADGHLVPANVFIVIQVPEGKTLSTTKGLMVNVSSSIGGARMLNVYCKTDFDLTGATAQRGQTDATKKYSLINEERKMELIYDVSIDVKETGTEGKSIRLNSSVSKN